MSNFIETEMEKVERSRNLLMEELSEALESLEILQQSMGTNAKQKIDLLTFQSVVKQLIGRIDLMDFEA